MDTHDKNACYLSLLRAQHHCEPAHRLWIDGYRPLIILIIEIHRDVIQPTHRPYTICQAVVNR